MKKREEADLYQFSSKHFFFLWEQLDTAGSGSYPDWSAAAVCVCVCVSNIIAISFSSLWLRQKYSNWPKGQIKRRGRIQLRNPEILWNLEFLIRLKSEVWYSIELNKMTFQHEQTGHCERSQGPLDRSDNLVYLYLLLKHVTNTVCNKMQIKYSIK